MAGYLGLDIGGANIKVADGASYATSVPFALWRAPELLAQRLSACIVDAPASDVLAVTMTGELADCFPAKSAGVAHIVHAVNSAGDGRSVFIYQNDGRFVSPLQAVDDTLLTAASNWHALAAFAVRLVGKADALLIDVGSTTCDFVPLRGGQPAPRGTNDTERLLAGELLYSGIERTPICGVTQVVEYRGKRCPVAGELFATMRDVYLVTGDLPEAPESCETADGRPATRDAAIARLGRMICADELQFCERDADVLARAVAETQVQTAAETLRRVASGMLQFPSVVVLSGHGDFLAHRLLQRLQAEPRVMSLTEHIGPTAARCAAAHAVAVLARERDIA